MSRTRLITLAALWLIPMILLIGFGGWALYVSGQYFWIWWTLPVCWGLAAWLWRRWGREVTIPLPDLDRTHWTPQDQGAWAIVEAEQKRIDEFTAAQLTDPQFYTKMTEELALKIAK